MLSGLSETQHNTTTRFAARYHLPIFATSFIAENSSTPAERVKLCTCKGPRPRQMVDYSVIVSPLVSRNNNTGAP